jgi:hypothetical protein
MNKLNKLLIQFGAPVTGSGKIQNRANVSRWRRWCGWGVMLWLLQGWPVQALDGSNCVPEPSDLVAWWSGNGSALDRAGTNTAFLRNGAGYGDGLVSRAFAFDGVNDYVEVPHNPAFHPRRDAGFTVECWVKAAPSQAGGGYHLIDKSHAGPWPWDSAEWALQGVPRAEFHRGANRVLVPGEIVLGLAAGATPTDQDPFVHVGTVVPVNDGHWHHVAVTWDGSTMRMYLDGLLRETVPFDGEVISNDLPLHLGYEPRTGHSPLNGLLDEVSIYKRALSAAEIAAIASAGAAGKCGLQMSIRVQQVEICWSSRPNAVYQVEYRSTLPGSAWTPLVSSIVATGTTMRVHDSVPSGEFSRIYRVLLPEPAR